MPPLSFSAFSDVVDGITRAVWNTSNLSEAAVRQAMVLPLLQSAGFNIWNPLEVKPEEPNAAGNRPDLIIRCGDGPERGFVLEIKRRGATLVENMLSQAMPYAGDLGLRWVWLTNGQVWILADEKLAGPYKEREVLRLELGKTHTTEDFAILLERTNWAEGKIEMALEQVLRERQRRMIREKVEAFQNLKGLHAFEIALEWMRDKNLLTEEDVTLLTSDDTKPESKTSQDTKPIAVAPIISSSSTIHKFPLEMTFAGRGGKGIALVFEDGSLELQPGSVTTAEPAPSQKPWKGWIEKLEQEGTVKRLDTGQYLFLKPVLYKRPSMSSDIISGSSTNGRDSWKTTDGKTHKDFFPYDSHNMLGKLL
jgi:predicted type IV restriction endonuclease